MLLESNKVRKIMEEVDELNMSVEELELLLTNVRMLRDEIVEEFSSSSYQ